MDPTHQGPEEYGQNADDSGRSDGRRRPSRESNAADFGQPAPQQARVVRLTAGDLLLTVNPVDGSEVEAVPPGAEAEPPVRRTPAERADHERAGAPPVPAGPPAPQLPLLERQEERERLVGLLARGRSVRLTGQAGSGRTALLDAVAADCADLAPDGVVRLNGHRRTATDLLYGLFDAVHHAPLHRPDPEELLAHVRSIGAVVVIDDLEIGGAALDELLEATPECAFLLGTAPDLPAPGIDAHLEEVLLAGLGRAASLELLAKVVERPLTEEEKNWAGDLWFESEGLPLRFVQAGSLLRQRDRLNTDPTAFDEYDYFEPRPDDAPPVSEAPTPETLEVPLPSLGEGAAPAVLLASRLSEAARETLRFTVALGGEVPHQAHLPALVGDTHADAALGELAHCGLLSPAGPRYRLAAGVLAQLEAGGYAEEAAAHALTAAQHYAWWVSHPSVTPQRAAAEADAIVAAMSRLVPDGEAGRASAAVLLARSAAPALAAGLSWGAWEKALRVGQEAARIAGEVAEEAYFHHELGVLALCTGNLDRARTELETSISMRGALADKSGAVAGRRALALVADRSGGLLPPGRPQAGDEVPAVRQELPAGTPPAAYPAPQFLARQPGEEAPTVVAPLPEAAPGKGGGRVLLGGARRNLAAAGAGALLVAVLGTVVTLGLTAGDPEEPGSRNVTTEQSSPESTPDDGFPDDEPGDVPVPTGGIPGGGTSATPSASEPATPSTSGSPSPGPSSPDSSSPGTEDPSSGPTGDPTSDGPSPSGKPTTPTKSPTPTPTAPTTPPTETPTTPPTETPTETPDPPDTSTSASGPAESASASAGASASATPSSEPPAEDGEPTEVAA
ncbi:MULTISPECIES: ATP-binding protein [Streptomyces]|uniref:ATP-binding protein n=1 Tax=Streptomyces TaxID=1883 RepID=UPI00103C4BE1|nr:MULTISPECIES: ATP-binding protein [Streptomyces]MBT3075579.1 ATP-binding protein [Streptomyces sp. COG21]MBT3079906.1 ATP-binding protein [Streptomyces sp. COG20]MBT3089218.1 ATP-binding protein [Streptomyces sp. CYG21]MBT3095676.1 ATP-binding protein [Streptomyces sp. CBG30]MBT3106222.1 ATP-binding protein [Streptomyces sp. COG19]